MVAERERLGLGQTDDLIGQRGLRLLAQVIQNKPALDRRR